MISKNVRQYLKWISAFCGALALFAIAIMIVGYQPLTIGRGATVAVLEIACAACAHLSYYGGWSMKRK